MMTALLVAITLALQPAQSPHDAAYWRSIKANAFAVPTGTTAAALSKELSALLGSPSPELRDDLAYSILHAWIVEKKTLSAAEIGPLMTEWMANLKRSSRDTENSVLRRSFSALSLSMIAERDLAAPVLSNDEFAALFNAALSYLEDEQDVRGYDDTLGWIHSAAHTADLLKFLGRSDKLSTLQQQTMLNAIGDKLRKAPVVFTFGEDERYARAIGPLLIRGDFDLAAFKAWVTRISTASTGPTTVASLHAKQNVTNMLAKLGVLLARQPTLPAPALEARTAVLAAVRF